MIRNNISSAPKDKFSNDSQTGIDDTTLSCLKGHFGYHLNATRTATKCFRSTLLEHVLVLPPFKVPKTCSAISLVNVLKVGVRKTSFTSSSFPPLFCYDLAFFKRNSRLRSVPGTLCAITCAKRLTCLRVHTISS